MAIITSDAGTGAGGTTGTGTGFSTIGTRIYGYSGSVVGSDSAVITVFSDRTPGDASYHLKIWMDIDNAGSFTGYLYINEVEVAKFFVDGGPVNWSTTPLELIVTPSTLIEVKAFDVSAGADHLVRIIGEEI